MALTRYVIKGADNASLQIVSTSLPATVTFASLTPVDGAFPTFTTAPVVYVLSGGSTRFIDVDTESTTSFRLIGSSTGPPGTYTIDIAVETADTPTAAPVGAAARIAPYYCSIDDVEDILANLASTAYTSGEVLDFKRRRRLISGAYGRIQAALAQGGYTLPVENPTKSLFTNNPGTTNSQTIDLPSGGDVANYPIGSTVRINSDISTGLVADEFTPVVSHQTTTQLTVEFLKNDHTANGTIELCTDGFLYLRHLNASCAAATALESIVISQGNSENKKVGGLRSECNAMLKELTNGEIVLNGLSLGGTFIESYQTNNSGDSVVQDEPTFVHGMKF